MSCSRPCASGPSRDVRFILCVPQNRPRSGLVIYDDAVFDAAQVRVDLALEVIRGEGMRAIGEVGDPDPFAAALDAVGEYSPQEIIVSTYPETRSGWLRRDLIERLRDATGLPVTHIVNDIDSEGLPFHVTLAVANRTASGDELLQALIAKAEQFTDEQHRQLFIVVVPAGGRRRQLRPAGADPAQARRRSPPRPRPVRGGHGRGSRPVHRDHEHACSTSASTTS